MTKLDREAMLSFTSHSRSHDRLSSREQKAIVAEVFAPVAWHVPTMIEAMWEASDFYFGSICQVFVDRGWRGRAVLLGDYQAAMRAYVAECQALPPGGVKGWAPQSCMMIGARNLSMRIMNVWPMRNVLARQFQKAEGITLRDYASPR